MITLHFKFSDHWDLKHQLIWQNKATSLASQSGDLLETTGLLIWQRILEKEASAPVVDGLELMYKGVDYAVMPSVKSFDKADMDAEPDKFDEVRGIYYRVKKLSHTQVWYVWAGLTKQSYGLANDIAIVIAKKIIDDDYKIMWRGEVTENGNFFPIYPSNSYLRAMSMARKYDNDIPFRSRLAYWFLPVWTYIEKVLRKYDYTDAFNTCMILFFMKKKRKLKAHMKRWPQMRIELEFLYASNGPNNPDVIQNDMKWYFILEMEKYVA